MEKASLTKTKRILTVMQVLAWIVFVGLMIQSGAVLFSYLYSLIKPDATAKFNSTLNFLALRHSDLLQYTIVAFFQAVVPGLKAYIAYAVIQTLSKVKLENPFTMVIVGKLESISYELVAIWAISILQHAHAEWLKIDTNSDWGGGETLFMAALIFVISQIFKRGVELQSESDLTV